MTIYYLTSVQILTTIRYMNVTRFWSRVQKADGCWLWAGSRSTRGYGMFRRSKGSHAAHRIAWELANGRAVPDGLVVRHTCDNPPCVNPAHLLIGTMADNYRDSVERGRRVYRRGYKQTLKPATELRRQHLIFAGYQQNAAVVLGRASALRKKLP